MTVSFSFHRKWWCAWSLTTLPGISQESLPIYFLTATPHQGGWPMITTYETQNGCKRSSEPGWHAQPQISRFLDCVALVPRCDGGPTTHERSKQMKRLDAKSEALLSKIRKLTNTPPGEMIVFDLQQLGRALQTKEMQLNRKQQQRKTR